MTWRTGAPAFTLLPHSSQVQGQEAENQNRAPALPQLPMFPYAASSVEQQHTQGDRGATAPSVHPSPTGSDALMTMFSQRPMFGRQPAVTTADVAGSNVTSGAPTVEANMDAASSTPSDDVPAPYDGDEYLCSICTTNFSDGERVVRVRCRHMFHGECWHNYILANNATTHVECPNCRGVGTLIAIWNFIAPTGTPT